MEKNYRKDATIDEVLAILDEHHSVYNRKAVLKAYAFAEKNTQTCFARRANRTSFIL